MARYPAAIWKPIDEQYLPGTRMVAFNRVNLHVAVSEAASLLGYFNTPGKPSSHFYVRKDGTVEQYVDTDYRAEADYEGNDTTISVETQGGVTDAQNEPWTSEQLTALAHLYAWAIATHGVAAKLATTSRLGEESWGLSSHRLGIDPYRVPDGMRYSTKYGKTCPGDTKYRQVPDVFALATGNPPQADQPAPAPVSQPVPRPAPRTWVSRGDTGTLVRELQTLLNAYGAHLAVDGSFGPATEAAVRAYQASRDLIIDGIAGDQTFTALRTGKRAAYVPAVGVLRRGSTGDEVRRLQTALRDGYPLYARKLVVDGLFGPATEAVVREFQRRSGLVTDGVVGPKTRAALGL